MRIICCIYKDFVRQLKAFLPSFCHLCACEMSPEWGHLIPWMDPMGHLNGILAQVRGTLNFQKVKCRGGWPGVDVEASIWPIHNDITDVVVMCDFCFVLRSARLELKEARNRCMNLKIVLAYIGQDLFLVLNNTNSDEIVTVLANSVQLGPRGVFPYITYIGMCCPIWKGFCAFLSENVRVYTLPILVWNRV